jgi:hypothetical protein
MRLFTAAALLALCLFGVACERIFEDNGTHLASVLGRGADELRASGASELVVRYTTLDTSETPYYVEITPSRSGGESNIASSYLVVSGKTPGGTSSHNHFVFVPARLYVRKDRGGVTEIVLRRDGDRIDVVDVR